MLILGFALAMYFSGQPKLQIAMTILTAIIYVVWGVFHHFVHHSFSIRIMLEYLAIAILGISLMFFVLQIAL